jgi:S1-C subfamily serine protease
VGFAIPAALVRRVVETAAGGGRSVLRPWLGVRVQAVTAESAKALGLDRPEGVLVTDVFVGAAGARAGLVVGDQILAVDGQPVNDQAALNYLIATHRVGDAVTLTLRRHSQLRALVAHVEATPATPPRDQRTVIGRNPMQGATVVNLSPAVADEYGLDPFLKGVLITATGQGIAARAGFQPGDIIRGVNGSAVNSVADLVAALGEGDGWRITVQRGEQQITVQF